MMIRRSLLVAVMALGVAACGGDKPEDGGAPRELRPDDGASVSTASAVTGMPVGELRSADPSLVELYKKLHANPELSFREVETSKLMADELRALGFTVTEGLGDAWVREKAMKDIGEVKPGVGGYGVVGVFENGRGQPSSSARIWTACPCPIRRALTLPQRSSRKPGPAWRAR